MTVQDMIDRLRDEWAVAAQGGTEDQRARHLERGKLLVRDRIELALDPGTSFLELSTLACHGLYSKDIHAAALVTGIGLVHGTPCVFIANDATVKGGALFPETVRKHNRAQEIAEENNLPCIYLVDCAGAYLPRQDGVFCERNQFGATFYKQCRMSARGLPQISVVFGGCTAGGAYIPALSDQVIMVRGTGRIHLGGPPIVKAAVKEIVDGETLGGADMHTTVSGVSDHMVDDEEAGLRKLREIMRNLGDVRRITLPPEPSVPPRAEYGTPQDHAPADLKVPNDSAALVRSLIDDSALSEFKPDYGRTLITGFARIHGFPVGIIANDGALFSESSVKGAHFIELCDQRQIPLLFLHNITGFMVGTDAERGGIAKHSAKLVYAVANARVPKFSVVVGGSYGAGNYGMCGAGFQPRFMFMWPNARICTLSPDVAATVTTDLRRASLRGTPTAEEIAQLDAETREIFETQSDPYYATARLWDDGLIEPNQTRDVLGLCLSLAAGQDQDTSPRPVYRM